MSECFDYRLVPLIEKRARYFIKAGATMKFNRGFAKASDVDAWTRDLYERGLLDWRCGAVFRLKGLNQDLWIVNKMGEPQ